MNALSYVFLVGGGAFALYSLLDLIDRGRLLHAGVRTRGRVIDRDRADEPDFSQPLWLPTIRFVDASGREVDFTPEESMTDAQSELGREVEVVYPPKDPRRAMIARASVAGPLFALAISIACAAIGALLMHR
ncbi:MAG: DUF3592 domain-containing protein [Acidobacteria bacterium]|nr:DUF3592 domain-containing protein [Acidobacteriota bacterium]